MKVWEGGIDQILGRRSRWVIFLGRIGTTGQQPSTDPYVNMTVEHSTLTNNVRAHTHACSTHTRTHTHTHTHTHTEREREREREMTAA